MDNNDPAPPGGRAERLTATAAARHLDIDRSTLYRWVKAGNVPEHRAPSGRPWYDPVELDAAMRQADDGGEAPDSATRDSERGSTEQGSLDG